MAVYDWEKFGFHIPEMMVPAEGADYFRWAVVACDQYTSEPEYWSKLEEIVGDAPSALRLILPEVYLNSPSEEERIASIKATMDRYLSDGTLRTLEPGCMLVRRTANGRTRLGLVIATDLESYDYNKGSNSLTRATEETVVERIPPRLRIRGNAPIEMPHIIILIDDPDKTVIEPLLNQQRTVIYDTDLMMDGGHITGSFIEERYLEDTRAALSALYDQAVEKYGDGNVIFQAMGDGNHSLATAKAAWEQLKQTLTPEEIETHPARYALCEIENIHDESMIFEPIHRVLFGRNAQEAKAILDEAVELLDAQNGRAYVLEAGASSKDCAESRSVAPDGADFAAGAAEIPDGAFKIPYLYGDKRGIIVIEEPSSKLEVGALQNALDVMVKERKSCDIDYIHGSETLERLAAEAGNVGFLLPSMDKFMLFPAVAADGALPRKTFSMGEANEKRYYIEARRILK